MRSYAARSRLARPATTDWNALGWPLIKRHGFEVTTQKTRDLDRQASEQEEVIQKYFNKLQNTISEHGITPEDIWNMDETGFQIGVGKNKLVVTKRRKRSSYLGVPTNRESATAIEAISRRITYPSLLDPQWQGSSKPMV